MINTARCQPALCTCDRSEIKPWSTCVRAALDMSMRDRSLVDTLYPGRPRVDPGPTAGRHRDERVDRRSIRWSTRCQSRINRRLQVDLGSILDPQWIRIDPGAIRIDPWSIPDRPLVDPKSMPGRSRAHRRLWVDRGSMERSGTILGRIQDRSWIDPRSICTDPASIRTDAGPIPGRPGALASRSLIDVETIPRRSVLDPGSIRSRSRVDPDQRLVGPDRPRQARIRIDPGRPRINADSTADCVSIPGRARIDPCRLPVDP